MSSYLNSQVKKVLENIHELGYLSVYDGKIIELTPPKYVFETVAPRWPATIKYIRDYAKNHRTWQGEYFLCIYDGWREYSPFVGEKHRQYVDWDKVDPTNFIGVGIAHEPRFRHRYEDATIYPELPLKVLTYNRHLNDRNAILIPDVEFLTTQFLNYLQQVESGDIPWEQKISKAVWRGSNLVMNENSFYDNEPASKRNREVAVKCSKNADFRDWLDAAFVSTPISWMLKHKYLLDIDGTVNAWSGFYWKMSSNSLVWKLQTHWEQWYYNLLVPNRHFVPLAEIGQVPDVFRWCEANQTNCMAIISDANRLVKTLTYQFAVTEYELH